MTAPTFPTIPHPRGASRRGGAKSSWVSGVVSVPPRTGAAWDVHRARIFGRCEDKTAIAPSERLARQVMSQEPYRSAARVFWVVDNGSSHRGEACQQRLAPRWAKRVVAHTPIHGSWLNQIEIFFSIVQRKVLTPNATRPKAA